MLAGLCYGAALLFGGLTVYVGYLPARSVGGASGTFNGIGKVPFVLGAGVLLLVAAGAAVYFGAFHQDHWSGPLAGEVRYGDAQLLRVFHFVLAVMCFVAATNTAWRVRWTKTAGQPGLCGLAGLATAGAAAAAFIMSIPTKGDDDLLLWPLLLMPLVGLAVLILATISLFALISSVRDH
jgi:uncharacterized membrane protein